MLNKISDYLAEEGKVIGALDVGVLKEACEVLLGAIKNGNAIYCFGNGGSASTASHLANDFNKILQANCICLNDNIATIMAIANDINYEEVFKFQLKNKLKPGDIVIAISGSGNSKNIINGAAYAIKNGATVIAFTGFDGGALKHLADINLHVPIDNMQITEDIHLMFNHLIVSVLSKFVS